MDVTPLFKACIQTVKLQNKSIPVPDKKRILKVTQKDDFSTKTKDIKFQITQLRNFLIENRATYMQFACHLKRSLQMTNEDRDIIDRESEKIINICTQFICELKLEYNSKKLPKQQRHHVDCVFELLADYLKSVYNVYNDQKNYRVKRDLETYKYLKLDSEPRKEGIDFTKIDYKDDMDLENKDNSFNIDDYEPMLNKNIEGSSSSKKQVSKTKSNQEEEMSLSNQSMEDDNKVSNLDDDETSAGGLSAEDIQMFEKENKQMFNEFKGLSEEVQQIEKHVYDIAKLQELFTEKVALQKGDIDRISNTVVGATENVKEANEQIKQAIQRNAGLRVYVLFFLLVMSFSLLFLDWYND
ncbi:unnamed protein product [Diamesa serratosioi]